MIGSRISSIFDGSGSFDGFSISITVPSRISTWYTTVGAVVMSVHVVFALQPLLHDVHVQQAEKAAAEAESQRLRGFRLVAQRRVVQMQFFQRVAQRLVLVGFHRIEAGKNLRLDFLEAGQRLGGRLVRERDRIADLCGLEFLDAGDDEAHFARQAVRSRDCDLGVNTPTCSHRKLALLDISRMRSLGRSAPSTTRTSMTTPT